MDKTTICISAFVIGGIIGIISILFKENDNKPEIKSNDFKEDFPKKTEHKPEIKSNNFKEDFFENNKRENLQNEFDRNNFKNFVKKNNLIEEKKCSKKHSEYIYNETLNFETEHSFRTIDDKELSKSYAFIGSLRDKLLKTLDYIEFNNKYGEYWSAESKIATNFYPYHICDVYRCLECNKLFLVYTEYSGHLPQQRIRNVKTELIVEEPSNCTFKISEDNINKILSFLNIEKTEFDKIIDENKMLDRIKTDFDKEKVIIKIKSKDSFLIVAKRETINNLIKMFS